MDKYPVSRQGLFMCKNFITNFTAERFRYTTFVFQMRLQASFIFVITTTIIRTGEWTWASITFINITLCSVTIWKHRSEQWPCKGLWSFMRVIMNHAHAKILSVFDRHRKTLRSRYLVQVQICIIDHREIATKHSICQLFFVIQHS